MFNKFLFVLAMLFVAANTTTAEAGRGLAVVSYTTVLKIADLPANDQLQIDGKQGMLGYKHSRIAVFWLPLFGSTQGEHVLYVDAPNGWRYFALDDNQAAALYSVAGLPIPKDSPVSAVSLYWGWLVVGPLCFLLILSKRKESRATSSEDPHVEETAPNVVLPRSAQQMPVTRSAQQMPMTRVSGGFGNRKRA